VKTNPFIWIPITSKGWLVGVTALSAQKGYIVPCKN